MYESPTSRSIASISPLLRDHYEAHTCYVAPSALCREAGEGLFAARNLGAGELGRISTLWLLINSSHALMQCPRHHMTVAF